MNISSDNTYMNAQKTILELAPTDYYEKVYRRGEVSYLPDVIKCLEKINHQQLDPVLEIGPGWGTLTLWLSRAGHKVTCLDKTEKGRWFSRRLLHLTGALYVHGDIFCPPYIVTDVGEKFKLITMTHVMAHFKTRPDRAIRNIAKILDDKGVFISAEFDREHDKGKRPYGNHWKAMPEYGSSGLVSESVTVGFSKMSMIELLSLHFHSVELLANGKELISICTKPKRGA